MKVTKLKPTDSMVVESKPVVKVIDVSNYPSTAALEAAIDQLANEGWTVSAAIATNLILSKIKPCSCQKAI
jgi:hypothetical protein